MDVIFSQVELQYIEKSKDINVMEMFDQIRKKDSHFFLNQYSGLVKLLLKNKGGEEWYLPRLLDDLQMIIDLIQSYEDKQEQHPYQLAISLNLLLGSLCLWVQQMQSNIYHDVEFYLLKLIKMSLKISYIPIRKVMILFYSLLKLEFNSKQKIKDRQYQLKNSEYQTVMKLSPKLNQAHSSTTEHFYRRLIVNQDENQLGQIIVVGLLRALVKTASSVSNNQQGVDIHKEWEEYYQDSNMASADYAKFKENTNHQELRTQNNQVMEEYDRHRIILNYYITEFFLFILKAFRNNCKVQCSYLIQLITDANGVLVFLKFFEKFNPQKIPLLENCVQNLVKLLYITCNNFPDKIINYLIDYKEYLAIKKFPGYFPDNEKIKKYSHLLLKIQIINFNKKSLKLGNTMKMISEVYCKYVQQIEKIPEDDSLLGCLYKFEKQNNTNDTIQSQEELRKLHHEYNNYHYWIVEHVPKQVEPRYKQPNYFESLLNTPIDHDFLQNYEQWLEENVYDYYD